MTDEKGVSAIEFALVFPVLLLLLLGSFDIGRAILVDQKLIVSSQVVADLVARVDSLDDDMLNEAVRAGELVIEPYDLNNFSLAIISAEFDDSDSPQLVWSEVQGMQDVPDVLDRANGLGTVGEGVVIVVVRYNFEPSFSVFSVDGFEMQEVAFARGRRVPVVQRG
ncbi:MAG: pilus assembly protein [Alphaproteobacteria bacterium]|nr:pilus assembly protein [Alphaproteobacteria bacterium]